MIPKRSIFSTTCIFLFLIIPLISASAQEIEFPESYDETTISPWGHTDKGTNWDTSPYLPFIYNSIAFRIMPPNGVTYDDSSDIWDFGSGEKYPIILFFHGAGEKGTDNNNQLKHGGRDHKLAVEYGEFPGFLLYPQNAYITDMKTLLDQLVAEGYPIDMTRVYVHGLSRGAVWSWEFALAYPEISAAIFPMSGVVGDDLSDLIYTPIRLAQGGLDRNPRPAWAYEVADDFDALGGDLELFYHEDLGHGTWYSQYTRNDFFSWFLEQSTLKIYAKHGYSEVCPEDGVDVTLGVNPGQEDYRWRKDDVLISGASDHELRVFDYGDYTVSYMIAGVWTDWSEAKRVGGRQPTDTPPISSKSGESYVLPDPNGVTSVTLTLPEGYESYTWYKDGVFYSTDHEITAGSGVYTALVQEEFGCSSYFSDPYTIIANTGLNIPAMVTGVSVVSESKSSLSVSWLDNSVDELAYELWRRTSLDEPYELIEVLDADTESYLDDGLPAGTTYFYSLRGINENGASDLSEEVGAITLIDYIIPSSPTDLTVTGSSPYSVSLSWNESFDDVSVEKYYVYQDGVKILSVIGSETEITVYGLEEGTTYTFNLTAVDPSGNESALSNRAIGSAVLSGLTYKYYEGSWSSLPDFASLVPVKQGASDNTDITLAEVDDYFGFIWEGYIKIPVAGSYTFETFSDDGSKLYIGSYVESDLVVDNDGTHGTLYKEGTYTFSASGTFPIVITYFERTGGNVMQVYWKNTAHGVTSRELIPDSYFTDAVVLPSGDISAATSFTATATSHSTVDLSWVDTNTSEVGYQIFRSSGFSNFESVGVLDIDATSYTDTELLPETTYNYKVVALGSYVEIPSLEESTTTLTFTPPTDFVVSASSETSIDLSWIASGAFGFELYRSTTLGGTYTLISTLDSDEFNYIDTGLSAHTEYFYSIRSFSSGVYSQYSLSSTSTLNSVPEIIVSIEDYVLDYEESVILTLTGTDEDGDALSFEGIGFSDFVSLSYVSDNSATLSISPEFSSIGSYTDLGVKVSDGFGGESDIILFDVEIYENQGPSIERLELYAYSEVLSEIHTELYADQSTVLSFIYTDIESDAIANSQIIGLPSFASYQQVNSNDGTLVLVPEVSDVGSYELSLEVEDAMGKTGTLDFIIDVVLYDESQDPVSDYEVVYVNFTSSAEMSAPSPWNNLVGTPESGHGLVDLLDATGVSTTIDLTLDNSWYGVANNGGTTGDDTGVYPDLVIGTHYQDNSSSPRTITLSGLNPLKIYDFLFFGSKSSRKGFDTRVTTFTVGTQTSGLIINENVSNTVRVKSLIPNASGELTIAVDRSLGSWQYLNSMEIRYYDEPTVPYEPSSFTATAQSHNSISLSWQDNSSNETGFELYRSTGSSGPWTLISTLSSDQTSYVDIDLTENTLYYYQIRSFNSVGTSAYSGVVQESTFVYSLYQSVLVNFTTRSSILGSSPWNNMFGSPELGLTLSSLSSTLGVETSLSLSLSEDWSGGDIYGATTGDDSGIYPDAVMETYFADYSENDRTLVISGCDVSKIYEVDVFGSLSWGTSSLLNVRVGAESSQLSVSSNTTELATVTKLTPNASGELHIVLSQGATNGPIYLNALEIRYYDEPEVPLAPSDLGIRVVSDEEIELFWTDNSTNETGFTLYKALSESGPWSLVTTLGEDVSSYIDENLEESTNYYYYLSSINLEGSSLATEVSSATTYAYTYYDAVLINFSEWSEASSPWNTLTGKPTSGLELSNMFDSRGGSTSVTITLQDDWLGSDGNGATTEDDTGLYPDEIMSTSFVDDSEIGSDLLLSGLDPNKFYDLLFFSSRLWVNGESTEYSVNGFSSSLIIDNNTSEYASIEGLIPNSSGELLVSVTKSAGSSLKYLNAMEVRYYEEPLVPFTPSNLVASAFSFSEVSLSWEDKSTNEEGFVLYRSTNEAGPWGEVATLSTGEESYTDTGLDDNTSYYYRVTAFNVEGVSNPSGVSNTTTHEYSLIENVQINFSGWLVAPSPWNTLVSSMPRAGLKLDNLINDLGYQTQMSIELQTDWSGSDSNGAETGDDTGVYPDAVMSGSFSDHSGESKLILLSGLNPDKLYDLVFFSSRKWVYNTTVEFTVGGEAVSLLSDDNITETISLEALSPSSSGEIQLEINIVDEDHTIYFNAMEVKSYFEPEIPFSPTNLTSRALSSESIELIWDDKSTNETEFELYRSTGGDVWELVTILGVGEELYIDTGLLEQTMYYYKIRSYNAEGYSEYSASTDETTYEYFANDTVMLNFSGWLDVDAPWNTLVLGDPAAGDKMINILTIRDLETTMELEFINDWSGSDGNGGQSDDDTGVYPNDVMGTSFVDNSNTNRELLLSGLDAGKVYNFTFLSSRKWIGGETDFTINGEMISLSVGDNISETAVLERVKPNVSGEILIEVAKGSGSSSMYLNAMVIDYYDEPEVPFAPDEFITTTESSSSIGLTWNDVSTNEDGFYIYRTLKDVDDWSLLASLSSGTESYTDSGLEEGAFYSYEVVAYNTLGANSSLVVDGATYGYAVYLNFGDEAYLASSPWNNTGTFLYEGDLTDNLKNELGNETGIYMQVITNEAGHSFTATGDKGTVTGDDSGVYPDVVMQSYFWMEQYETASVKFTGLKLNEQYDFEFFASRESSSRGTVFTIGDKSVEVDAAYNTSVTASINSIVSDDNGEIYLDMVSIPGVTLAYVNAIVIRSSSAHGENEFANERVVLEDVVEEGIERRTMPTIYPNPFNENLHIDLYTTSSERMQVTIFDQVGRVLHDRSYEVKAGQHTINLETDAFESGWYLVNIVHQMGGIDRVKVIKK